MFLLKKIVSGMLMPVPLVLELLIAGVLLLWFTRRQVLAKALVTAGTLLLLLEGFGVLSQFALSRLEGMYSPVGIQEARDAGVKWVVVLAGGSSESEALPVTSQLAPETQVRMNEGIRILRGLSGARLIVSGGRVFGTVPTAELMERLAVELGVSPNAVVREDRSRDTGEQAGYIGPLVKGEPFVLVTSAYHMPRAMALFKARGMSPIPAPTGHYAASPDGLDAFDFFPRADRLSLSEIVLHELLGLLAFQLGEALTS
ncbi:MAG TPA: ElyC/SanA/YdcF family protein [Deltaproteobacteria bacterium]|nr:ElyC/SanA/YdcF family protein [Deltaproteobacteria bacterium]